MQMQMQGLWSEHFPAADKPSTLGVHTSPTKMNLPAPPAYQRCLLCPKCNTSVWPRTSKTDRNPDRLFYSCPANSNDHKFFKWADEVNTSQLIDVPNCGGCGAGLCRIRRETTGPNAGRILFLCRVKEGEGSCGYRVWQDELETGDERISSSQFTNNIEESVNTSEHLHCREIISTKKGQSKCQQYKPRPHKRSRCGDAKASSSSLKNVPVKYSWMDDAKRQNLNLQGWWGRLAFHPMPCLVTYESNPFTCDFSSPLASTFVVQDPILVYNIKSTTLTMSRKGVNTYGKPLFNLKKCRNILEEKIVVNSGGATTVTRNLLEAKSYGLYSCENTELSGAALDVPSLSKTKMSKSISNAFCEAAQRLQNDLLTLLETMDVKDHMAMREAAEATFAALDHLLFSNQDFKNCVNELIQCASSLSEIEQSMPTNDSYQRLVERCSSERKRLDEINSAHAETINTVTKKKKCLKDLQEEISSTLEMLFIIEAEISCFEIEMRNMEIKLEQISRDKEELEGKYLIAFEEVEKSKKLLERKEEEHGAAKAAYHRARALLRSGFGI